MKKEYKEFIINGLYGLIDGSSKSLEGMLVSNFKMRFGFEADKITVIESNRRFITEGNSPEQIGCWIGAMEASIVIDGETFSCIRDWGEEWDVDSKHPDYHSDDWFYEGDKCFSSIKYKEIISAI